MVSSVHNNWKGHFGISVSELCFKNALGILINNRLNFRDERIIVRKIAATFWEERIIVRKFGMNQRAKWIIIWKIAQVKTIGVTKMRGNFVEISFQVKFLRKARNFVEICLHYFCTILYSHSKTPIIAKKCMDFWAFQTSQCPAMHTFVSNVLSVWMAIQYLDCVKFGFAIVQLNVFVNKRLFEFRTNNPLTNENHISSLITVLLDAIL